MKTLRWMLLFAALFAALSACGRRSDLERPPDAEAPFPRTYPAR